jgi:hypothetical protein
VRLSIGSPLRLSDQDGASEARLRPWHRNRQATRRPTSVVCTCWLARHLTELVGRIEIGDGGALPESKRRLAPKPESARPVRSAKMVKDHFADRCRMQAWESEASLPTNSWCFGRSRAARITVRLRVTRDCLTARTYRITHHGADGSLVRDAGAGLRSTWEAEMRAITCELRWQVARRRRRRERLQRPCPPGSTVAHRLSTYSSCSVGRSISLLTRSSTDGRCLRCLDRQKPRFASY